MYVWFMFLSHKYFEPRLLINYSLQQIFISQNYFIFMLLYALVQRRQWHPTPVLLPGQSHGQRSLVGCSPWSREKSDTTERLHFHFSLSCIGEGNGNPLQCPCLENPRDGGAWWAAICGATQSRTQLKQLSSSSRPQVGHWKKTVNSYLYDTWNFIKKRNGIIKLLCGFIFIKKIS